MENREILPEVSVIIPVFNVALYLHEALDSVVNQSYKKLEILIIDDGSTDGSGEICDEYKSYPRVKVIHQNNKGLSAARNVGLNQAKGDYIAFLDSDDTYDFGSGNMNHLIPRIKLAVAELLGVKDFWNVDVMFAAGHFHDVCISKEGQTEGVELPLKVYYKGEEQALDHNEIFSRCKIAMPVDAQRNMMNASSNYGIIDAVISAIRTGENKRIFTPGVFGKIGGYPVIIGYRDEKLGAWIDESVFSYEEMNKADRASMALDGVEDVKDGTLIYTDYLIEKAKKAFGVELPKTVAYDDIEKTAQFIIDEIILPQTEKK